MITWKKWKEVNLWLFYLERGFGIGFFKSKKNFSSDSFFHRLKFFCKNDKFNSTGYLVTDVVGKMILKSSKQLQPNRKLFIYSGHDTTLINVLRALNITSQTTNKPDFTSSLHFEMHHNRNIEHDFEVKVDFCWKWNLLALIIVKEQKKNFSFNLLVFCITPSCWSDSILSLSNFQLFYRFNSESDLKQINIPNCDRPCSLAAFIDAVEHIIVYDYEQECSI